MGAGKERASGRGAAEWGEDDLVYHPAKQAKQAKQANRNDSAAAAAAASLVDIHSGSVGRSEQDLRKSINRALLDGDKGAVDALLQKPAPAGYNDVFDWYIETTRDLFFAIDMLLKATSSEVLFKLSIVNPVTKKTLFQFYVERLVAYSLESLYTMVNTIISKKVGILTQLLFSYEITLPGVDGSMEMIVWYLSHAIVKGNNAFEIAIFTLLHSKYDKIVSFLFDQNIPRLSAQSDLPSKTYLQWYVAKKKDNLVDAALPFLSKGEGLEKYAAYFFEHSGFQLYFGGLPLDFHVNMANAIISDVALSEAAKVAFLDFLQVKFPHSFKALLKQEKAVCEESAHLFPVGTIQLKERGYSSVKHTAMGGDRQKRLSFEELVSWGRNAHNANPFSRGFDLMGYSSAVDWYVSTARNKPFAVLFVLGTRYDIVLDALLKVVHEGRPVCEWFLDQVGLAGKVALEDVVCTMLRKQHAGLAACVAKVRPVVYTSMLKKMLESAVQGIVLGDKTKQRLLACFSKVGGELYRQFKRDNSALCSRYEAVAMGSSGAGAATFFQPEVEAASADEEPVCHPVKFLEGGGPAQLRSYLDFLNSTIMDSGNGDPDCHSVRYIDVEDLPSDPEEAGSAFSPGS